MGVKMFKTSIAFTTATALTDRFMDAVTLLLFIGISVIFLPDFGNDSETIELFGASISGDFVYGAIQSLSLLCLALLVFILLLAIEKPRLLIFKFLSRLPLIGNFISNKASRFISELARGLESFRSARNIAFILVQSFLVWLALAIGTYLLSFGFEGFVINFPEALIITSFSIAGAAIPSAPGAWGTFEAGALIAIKALGIECDDATAIAYAFAMHFGQYVAVMLGGIVMMFVSGTSAKEIKKLIAG